MPDLFVMIITHFVDGETKPNISQRTVYFFICVSLGTRCTVVCYQGVVLLTIGRDKLYGSSKRCDGGLL